jgi:hypothetical protein
MSLGTIVLTDTSGAQFTMPCQVKTGGVTNPSTYTAPYSVTSANEIIGAFGIGVTDAGLSVLVDMASTPMPVARTLNFDNAGAVGWLEDLSGTKVGWVCDGGLWRLEADVPIVSTSQYTPFYFPEGYVLAAYQVRRQSQDPNGGDSALGCAVIEMLATNGTAYSAIFTSQMKNILGINSVFQVGFPSSTTDLSSVGNVLSGLTYWVVPGVTSQRLDVLYQSATVKQYVAPNPASYGSPATPSGDNVNTSTNSDGSTLRVWEDRNGSDANSRRQRNKRVGWFIMLVVLLIIFGTLFAMYWYYWRKPKAAQKKVAASTSGALPRTSSPAPPSYGTAGRVASPSAFSSRVAPVIPDYLPSSRYQI